MLTRRHLLARAAAALPCLPFLSRLLVPGPHAVSLQWFEKTIGGVLHFATAARLPDGTWRHLDGAILARADRASIQAFRAMEKEAGRLFVRKRAFDRMKPGLPPWAQHDGLFQWP